MSKKEIPIYVYVNITRFLMSLALTISFHRGAFKFNIVIVQSVMFNIE